MFDIQESWVWCELTIDEGYNRKSGIIFYRGFTTLHEIELAYNKTIEALAFLQENDLEITIYSETYYGEVTTFCLSRKST